MKGVSCNGWRFWSVEGDEPEKPTSKPKATALTGKLRQLRRMPNQKGVAEGSVKWLAASARNEAMQPEQTHCRDPNHRVSFPVVQQRHACLPGARWPAPISHSFRPGKQARSQPLDLLGRAREARLTALSGR